MPSTRKHRKPHARRRAQAGKSDALPRTPVEVSADLSKEGDDFIDQTVAIWQKHTTRPLAREDGREIIENMTGFFRVLHEWQQAEPATPNKRKALQQKRNARQPA